MAYWLATFTARTWDEFRAAGGRTPGFREGAWSALKTVKVGDTVLCYLTGISRWAGLLEVVGSAYRDDTPIWQDEVFPCRLPVQILVGLEPETAVPVLDQRDQLSVFRGLKNPNGWSIPFRRSPTAWSDEDGQIVEAAVRAAAADPVVRPLDPNKLRRKPRYQRAAGIERVVTDPRELDDDADQSDPAPEAPPLADDSAPTGGDEPREATAHTEIQYQLLKLGSDMGLSVWVARNDRSRTWYGLPFSNIPRMRADLPQQFDAMTTRTIELIDVLWLSGTTIVAAFEVESTTSVYSGLLRMADLLALQPNLHIPLFIVAPDERRNKVVAEINRPTFAALKTPLCGVCRFIPFSTLRERTREAAAFVRHLKPDVLQDWSESCDLEDD